MIPLSHKQGVILGASSIAVLLVVGAYFLSRMQGPQTLSAESSDEILKEYAARDTDGDGVPDWQEALYGTDPENPNSVRADLTDAEALAQGLVTASPRRANNPVTAELIASLPGKPPASGSLTEKFAVSFFEAYTDTLGTGKLTGDALQAFVEGAVNEILAEGTRADAYGTSTVSVSAMATLQSYAADAERAFTSNAIDSPYGELAYFADAVMKSDDAALERVRLSGERYRKVAASLAKVPVPQMIAEQHLALVNAIGALGDAILDMAALKDDPVRAMLGYGSYETDVRTFAGALGKMKQAYDDAGARVSGGSGASFYALMSEASSLLATAP